MFIKDIKNLNFNLDIRFKKINPMIVRIQYFTK